MNWRKPRSELKLMTSDLNYVGRSTSGASDWSKVRLATLNHRKNTCRFCGGTYTKYMLCFHLDNDPFNNTKDNLDIACKLCYVITHINFGYIDDVVVCHSVLSQLEISRRTVEYVVKNGKAPKPVDIDAKVTRVPISVMELCSILLNTDGSLPPELSEYKLFITDKFDTSFTGFREAAAKPYMFTESDDEDDAMNPIENTVPLRKLTTTERTTIDKILDVHNSSSTTKQMKRGISHILDLKRATTPSLSQISQDVSPTMVSKILGHSTQTQ